MRKIVLSIVGLLATASAQATVYYVDSTKADNTGAGTSWAAAKKDVQDAINLALVDGDEVWVKAGTYLPTMDPSGIASPTAPRDKTFYITTKNIKLYGGFAGTETTSAQRNADVNVTILSGDLDGLSGTADAYHVMLTASRNSTCVVDGFTLTGGRADGTGTTTTASFSFNQDYGGGMYNRSSGLTVRNCIFTANTALTNGGGIYSTTTSPVVRNCTFSANTAGNGGGMYNSLISTPVSNCIFYANTASSAGGAMYNTSGNVTIANCLFVANTAATGGAMYTNSNFPVMRGCTIYGNTATGSGGLGGGLYYTSSGGGTVTNCILWNNTTPANSGDANREEIYKAGNVGLLTANYNTIDYHLATNYPSSATNGSSDPLFANTASPAGTDGRWSTADDGLRIGCASPAKDAGNGTALTTDILGATRNGACDQGAYEAVSTTASNTIPAVSTAVAIDQTATVLSYSDCTAEVAKIDATTTATLTGSTLAKVYVQSTAPFVYTQPYVRRYYDITPSSNANTAMATVTLYFTQADFDDYNTNRGSYPSLPVDSTDALNYKSNLRVTQQHGTSATGAPGTFSGWSGSGSANVLIMPTLVTWNSPASRWEVTFPVTGFSGFFAHTTSTNTPLPASLLSFSGRATGKANDLNWTVAHEKASTVYAIERSTTSSGFETIGTVRGTEATEYHFEDGTVSGTAYYRLRIASGGEESYSAVVVIRRGTAAAGYITLAPQPAAGTLTVSSTDRSMDGSVAFVIDVQGREMTRFVLSPTNSIDISGWAPGMYALRLPDGEVLRVVKQ
jgi:predicted outer membrane repeat protein